MRDSKRDTDVFKVFWTLLGEGEGGMIWENGIETRKLSYVKWSEVTQSCPTLCDPVDCSLPGSSVHGILQARILEWVAISFSRNLPDPGIEPRSPTLLADALRSEPPGKPIICEMNCQSRSDAWDRVLWAGALGWPRAMGWGGRLEGGSGWGTHVHPWRIQVNVWQKPIQYYKVKW